MRRFFVVWATCVLPACSSSSNGESAGPGHDAGGNDATSDGSAGHDAATGTETGADGSPGDAAFDATGDAAEAGCPAAWLEAPVVDPTITVPTDGGAVVLHAAGSGTQNYSCTAATDGGTSWVLTGPTASLSDCTGALIGHHFASDAGSAFPEWQTVDGTYVVGHKLAAFTPDGGAASVPWLLLQGVDHGGAGALSDVAYVQRLYTDGGVAPGPGCDAGDTVQVPYAAGYYFYGP
jgi:hypothetical protein